MTRPDEFRVTLRQGRRGATSNTVIHVLTREPGPSRFGFIVSKAVGGAVVRNQVKRRLRAVCREMLPQLGGGKNVVVRALPSIRLQEFDALNAELINGVRRLV